MLLDSITIQKHFERFEGRSAHMYLCAADRVTVGIGHVLPAVDDAKKLTFRGASAESIAAEWRRVAEMSPGRLAQFYRRTGQPLMHDGEITRLFWADIEAFRAALRTIVKDYDTLPATVQLALLDMIYTLGPSGLAQYKRMLGFLRARNWKAAAAECKRAGIPERGDRHKTVRLLLESPR